MSRKILLCCAAFLFLAASACRTPRNEVEETVSALDVQAREGHTLSALVSIEQGLAAFVREKGRIPDNLDELVPGYLGMIPPAETGIHGDSSKVKVYPSSVLSDGQVNGTRIKDAGGWGYVHNQSQAVVFVDCVHRASNGKAWYLQRGAY
jgi:hypothetical protein